jgi:hypothetical protein
VVREVFPAFAAGNSRLVALVELTARALKRVPTVDSGDFPISELPFHAIRIPNLGDILKIILLFYFCWISRQFRIPIM